MEMNAAIEKLVEVIKAEYADSTGTSNEFKLRMIAEFNAGITVEVGRKYIKIAIPAGSSRSVWGFIVNTDNDKKFKKGDILKAAGWKTPARNAARGNVFDDEYSVCWTGPHYM